MNLFFSLLLVAFGLSAQHGYAVPPPAPATATADEAAASACAESQSAPTATAGAAVPCGKIDYASEAPVSTATAQEPSTETPVAENALGADAREQAAYTPPENYREGTNWDSARTSLPGQDAKTGVYDGGAPGDGLKMAFLDKAINQYGKSPETAAAIAGNLSTESDMFKTNKYAFNADTGKYELDNPQCWNGMCKYGAMAEGDFQKGKATSFGIMQAHDTGVDKLGNPVGRGTDMTNFVNEARKARADGSSYVAATRSSSGLKGSLNDQQDYMFQKDIQDQAKSFKNLNRVDTADNLYDKTEAFTKNYERPANAGANDSREARAAGMNSVPFDRAGGVKRLTDAQAMSDFAASKGYTSNPNAAKLQAATADNYASKYTSSNSGSNVQRIANTMNNLKSVPIPSSAVRSNTGFSSTAGTQVANLGTSTGKIPTPTLYRTTNSNFGGVQSANLGTSTGKIPTPTLYRTTANTAGTQVANLGTSTGKIPTPTLYRTTTNTGFPSAVKTADLGTSTGKIPTPTLYRTSSVADLGKSTGQIPTPQLRMTAEQAEKYYPSNLGTSSPKWAMEIPKPTLYRTTNTAASNDMDNPTSYEAAAEVPAEKRGMEADEDSLLMAMRKENLMEQPNAKAIAKALRKLSGDEVPVPGTKPEDEPLVTADNSL